MTKMKASDAVEALVDRTNPVLNPVTIPEEVAKLSGAGSSGGGHRDHPPEEFEAVLNPAATGLPEWAGTATRLPLPGDLRVRC